MSIIKPSRRQCAYSVAIALLTAGMLGCPKEEGPAATTPAPTPTVKPATPPASEPEARIDPKPGATQTDRAAVVAQLAKADAYDGATDKVVSKCAVCGLRMDGSASHAATVDGYTLHMCSDSCRKSFEKDPDATILALNIEEDK